MKKYGNDSTQLTLTPEAQAIYDATDPLNIYELDNGTYKITGCLEADNLTAEQVNATLIGLDKDMFLAAVQDWKADQQYDDLIIEYSAIDKTDEGKWYAPAHDSDHSYMLVQDYDGNICII